MAVTTGPVETRTAILAAAESEFGMRGYRDTRIEAVAKVADVSRPLVYRYFGDKQGLYRQVVARVLRDWNDALVEVAERPAPSCRHTLRLLIRTCIEWAAERDFLRGVLLWDVDAVHHEAGNEMAEGRDRLPTLLAQVLARGVADGEVRADLSVDDMAFVLAEVTISGSIQALGRSDGSLDDARLEAMIETVLHGVLLDR